MHLRPLALGILALVSLSPVSQAQIYADFTVSHGETPLGTFRARLDFDKAPRTCANFIGLATGRRPWIRESTGELVENTPFYNGLIFHRLVHNFVIQGGSPNGQGTDGPGYSIPDEYHASLRHTGPYLLSMAKSSLPNTGSSQFFITLAATAHLDDKHSIFGEIIAGRDIIDGFMNVAGFPTTNSRPNTPITIQQIAVSGPDDESFSLDSPSLRLPVLRPITPRPLRNQAEATFSLLFPRRPHCEYRTSYSTDLSSWTSFYLGLSRDQDPEEEFRVSGVDLPKFFMRCIEADYSQVFVNAPTSASVLANGRKLRIGQRSGQWLELTFNGSTGGSWSASNGGSGTLSNVGYFDPEPAVGIAYDTSSLMPRLPLGQLNATFSAAAGNESVTRLQNLILSFHDPLSGWVEGTAITPTGSFSMNQSFTLSP